MSFARKIVAGCLGAGTLAAAGIVGASVAGPVDVTGGGSDPAALSCPGGMTRLGHPFDGNMSIFPGDPAVHVRELYTVAVDFFKVEDIDMGAHAGTHIDVPAHFIDENDAVPPGRTLDQLEADEFVWPVYKIDVRGMSFDDNFIEADFIDGYVTANGTIPAGALVVLQTGAEDYFGLGGAGDEYGTEKYKDKTTKQKFELSANIDDLFDFENAGFSGAAVQHLVDEYGIAGVGSDAYGPDAFGDDLFDATYTILANDGVAVVALANLDAVNVTGDIMIAPAVNLTNGSGFPVDPLACHGAANTEG
jgi:kynurenine formamidase